MQTQSASTLVTHMKTAIVVGIILTGLLAAVVSPFIGLQLYVWFSLFNPQQWLWIDISSARPGLVIGIVLVGRSIAGGRWPHLRHPISYGMTLFMLAGLLAQHSAIDAATGWLWLDFAARLILVCLLAITLVDDERKLRITVAVAALSFGYHSANFGLASMLSGGAKIAQGLSGAFGSVWQGSASFSLGTLMIAYLLLCTAQNAKSALLRWACIAIIPLTLWTVVFSFSRGAFLALGASAVVFTVLQRRPVVALGRLALIVGVLIAVMPLPDEYVDRIQTITTYEEIGEESALSRLHFWRVALEMVKDRPLGVGMRNYEAAYDSYDFSAGRFGQHRAVHSSYFQVLAETGIAGLVIYISLLLGGLRICWRISRATKRLSLISEADRFYFTMANALASSLAAFVVGGAFLSLSLNELTWLLLALIAALDRLHSRIARAPHVEQSAVSYLAPNRVA